MHLTTSQYIDTLLEDLGINTRRTTNIFAELFRPVAPRDYNGLLDEFRAVNVRAGAKAQKTQAPNGEAATNGHTPNGNRHDGKTCRHI